MGNYNCRECFEKDMNNINEMVMNSKLFQSEQIQDNNRGSRAERLKVLKSNHEDFDINNLETNIINRQSPLQSPKTSNKVTHNILKKEDINNNNIPKKEKRIKTKKNNIIINNHNSDDINNLIELQRKQILEQEKIIEELKNKQSLFDEQQKQLEQAQKKIREQQSQLELKEIENNKTQRSSLRKTENKYAIKDNINVIKTSQTQTETSKQKLKSSKSSPNNQLKIAKKEKGKIIQEQNKFENIQIMKPHFINKEEINKNINESDRNEIEVEENQIEENDNYERIGEYDEEEDEGNNLPQPKSQKFKIETYEPVETSNKNENNDNNIIDKRTIEDEKILEKKDKDLKPRDSQNIGLKKDVIPRPNYKDKNKDIYERIKKREIGPRDSGKNNNININFRGTFENDNKTELEKEKFSSKKKCPRDSKRKGEFNNSINNYTLKDITNSEEKNLSHDIIINEQQEANLNPLNLNDQELINNQPYTPQLKINDDINGGFLQQEQYNNSLKGDINSNNIFTNNVYFSPDFNFSYPKDSPKFNSILGSQNNEVYNEDNNISLKNDIYQIEEIENYRNSGTIGNYLNEIDDINISFTNNPFIFQKENEKQMNQTQELNTILNLDLNNNIDGFNQVNNRVSNPLMFSNDRINKDYFEKNINEF